MTDRARVIQVYIANFFFSLHYAVILYVNSSFLSKFFSRELMAGLFMVGSLWGIVLFIFTPSIIARLGTKRFFIYALVAEYAALAVLATSSTPASVALAFIAYGAVVLMIPLSLDIFLEAYSREAATGRIRGTNLTLGNLAILIAPLIVAVVAFDAHFKLLYVASALFLLPLVAIALSFKRLRMPFHGKNHDFDVLARLWKEDKDLRRVTFVRLALEFFYALMVIYTPLYLYQEVGFSWHTIGIVFAVMLLPFVLFERYIGYLADLWVGEREIMTAGLIISASALIVMPFLGLSALAWAIALFVSRVGAASVEVTTESYFFKRVTVDDAGLISLFRLTRPTATFLGALAGMVVVGIYSYSALFLSLAAVMLVATLLSFPLRDTR